MKDWMRLLCATTAFASVAAAAPALAAGMDEVAVFEIGPGRLDEALIAYSRQADVQVISASVDLAGKRTRGVTGERPPREALALLLRGSDLSFVATSSGTVTITGEQGADGSGAGNAVDALIVTAQKKEEAIQDVPIAISAFSSKALDEQKIEGGFDLLKAIPNVTFSKNNFSSYNFSIRGVGTKAISVTTDPGVAVEFNGTPLIRNRLFEQEYFDVERVEVLRGPQGTLHGRNATAGVINVVSRIADLGEFSGSIKGEVGNFNAKRMTGFLNAPLVEDVLAVRLAGSMTIRDGYDYNSVTNNPVNGRDLWSARLTATFEPHDRARANLIWERFSEDDNRSRTGKQLCHRDPGLRQVGATIIDDEFQQAYQSQGCKPGNLYADEAFGTPNGISIPFVLASGHGDIGWVGFDRPRFLPDGSYDPASRYFGPLLPTDPYGGMMQSRDLRTIASFKDPRYRALADVVELNMEFDITDGLTLSSQTAYNNDDYYSFQDFNRFNTLPIFADTSNAWEVDSMGNNIPSPLRGIAPGGVYCDPQLGCSDTLAGFDISQAKSEQFSQEFRLQSNFEGPINFGVGANYLRYETLEDYYVFFNLVTQFAQIYSLISNNSVDWNKCFRGGEYLTIGEPGTENCIYIDPNPIESINGEGHNYYRSKNPYELSSYGLFGELYWQATDALKVTAGLRYTDDRKTTTPVPTQALLSAGLSGGVVGRGYPSLPDIEQQWQEVTGRIGVDWKPVVPFTDQSMFYAFYSHGYKGGGANPPGIGLAKGADYPIVTGLAFPETFDPEYVDAFEVGTKNTLLEGSLIVNLGAFFYDYKSYQISKIVDRTAISENFDATIWGVEFESVFRPTRSLRFNMTLGYQDTAIGDGERSIDLMDRTQGNPDYVVVKPYPLQTSNCVVSVETFQSWGPALQWCPGFFVSFPDMGYVEFNETNFPNGGQGFYADVSDNELPNAPHWTTSFGAEYAWDMSAAWRATMRTDFYWQSQSWARVYNNDPYDKLHGWYNVNLSVWLEREDGLKIELYAKNLLDKTPITDAFLNSDDTGLTTNVFVLDPRLLGFSIRKDF